MAEQNRQFHGFNSRINPTETPSHSVSTEAYYNKNDSPPASVNNQDNSNSNHQNHRNIDNEAADSITANDLLQRLAPSWSSTQSRTASCAKRILATVNNLMLEAQNAIRSSDYSEEEERLGVIKKPMKKKPKSKRFKTLSELHKNNTKGSYQCKICGELFSDFHGLGGHVAAHNKKAEDKKEKEQFPFSNEKASSEYKCDECFRSFPTGQALGGHKSYHRKTECRGGYGQSRDKDGDRIVYDLDLKADKEEKEQFPLSNEKVSSEYKCEEECRSSFPTGQANGDHRKAECGGYGQSGNKDGDGTVNELDLNVELPDPDRCCQD